MMTLLTSALAYAGFAGLCLAMRRHHRQLWGRQPSRTASARLRLAGWLCLISSIAPCIVAWGSGAGTVAWFGILTAAGLVLAFLLPYAPRAAALLGLLGPMAAAAISVIAATP